eukprot:7225721-Pyramimonas_sp.AAC.1
MSKRSRVVPSSPTHSRIRGLGTKARTRASPPRSWGTPPLAGNPAPRPALPRTGGSAARRRAAIGRWMRYIPTEGLRLAGPVRPRAAICRAPRGGGEEGGHAGGEAPQAHGEEAGEPRQLAHQRGRRGGVGVGGRQ